MGLFDEVKLLHSPLSPITELYRNRWRMRAADQAEAERRIATTHNKIKKRWVKFWHPIIILATSSIQATVVNASPQVTSNRSSEAAHDVVFQQFPSCLPQLLQLTCDLGVAAALTPKVFKTQFVRATTLNLKCGGRV
jgi:hypothetical protein